MLAAFRATTRRTLRTNNIQILKLVEEKPFPVHHSRETDRGEVALHVGIGGALVGGALGVVEEVFGLDVDAGVAAGDAFAGAAEALV